MRKSDVGLKEKTKSHLRFSVPDSIFALVNDILPLSLAVQPGLCLT